MTELHEAASIGNIEILKECLNTGFQPNDIDFEFGDKSALHLAVAGGYSECVSLLLLRGANVNCRLYDHTTPLHIACEVGNISIIQILLNFGSNPHLCTR